MSTCPVCGKPAEEGAPSSEYKGQVYYFACPGCKARFDEDPERYLAAGPQTRAARHDHHHCH